MWPRFKSTSAEVSHGSGSSGKSRLSSQWGSYEVGVEWGEISFCQVYPRDDEAKSRTATGSPLGVSVKFQAFVYLAVEE